MSDPFRRLTAYRDLALTAEARMRTEARRLHDVEGRSWAQIGAALGVSRQAAWERFREGARRG